MSNDSFRKHAEMFSAGCAKFDATLFASGEQFSWKTRRLPGSDGGEFIFYSPDEYKSANLDRQAELASEFVIENAHSCRRLASFGIPMDITLLAEIPYSEEVQGSLIGLIQIPRSLSKHAATYGIGVNVLVFARVVG